jgi:hypothetical protein
VKAAKCTECADGETACVEGELATCEPALDGICRVFGDPEERGKHQVCDDTTEEGPKLVCEPTECTGEDPACPGGSTWITCVKDEDGCLYVSEEPTLPCASGLECGPLANSCVCPDAVNNFFYVDPVEGSEADADPAPTGAQAPAKCRFKALGRAVELANAKSAVGGTATVMVSSTGETPPPLKEVTIELMPGVTLTSDAPTNPTGPPADLPYVLEVSGTPPGSTDSAPGVTLHEGATFSGLKLQPAAEANVTDAIVTECASGATDPAVVRDAMVLGTNGEGGARFVNGVHQTGACPIDVERTLLEGNGKGAFVEANAATTVRIDACEVRGSRDVGVLFRQVPSTVDVHFTNTTVHGNCATIPLAAPGGSRRGGGVSFDTMLPTVKEFWGNKIKDNQGDQVLVASTLTSPTLDLTGDGAASDSLCPNPERANHFACRDASGGHVAVYSSGAVVSALGNFWSNVPPVPNLDFVSPVDPIGNGGQVCGQDTACAGTPTSCP